MPSGVQYHPQIPQDPLSACGMDGFDCLWQHVGVVRAIEALGGNELGSMQSLSCSRVNHSSTLRGTEDVEYCMPRTCCLSAGLRSWVLLVDQRGRNRTTTAMGNPIKRQHKPAQNKQQKQKPAKKNKNRIANSSWSSMSKGQALMKMKLKSGLIY